MSSEIPNKENESYFKKYYEINKEQLQAKAKAKVVCPLCDKIMCKGSLNTHLIKSNSCSKRQQIKIKQLIMGKLINENIDIHYDGK
jgi:hypothetical protein